MHPAYTKVSEFILIGNVSDGSFVSHAVLFKLMFDIEDVLKGCSLTGTHTVSQTNEEFLLSAGFHFFNHCFELMSSMDGMVCCTDRDSVLTQSTFAVTQTWGSIKVELGASSIDQVVVGQLFALAFFVLTCIFDSDECSIAAFFAFWMYRNRLCLTIVNACFFVYRCQCKGHILFCHFAHTDEDIGGNPVP